MARKALPVFAWDQPSLSMKELTPDEAEDVLRVRHQAGAPHFHALVADDDDEDRLLTIWQLGAAWPVAEGLTVECAADGVEALEKISRGRYALVILDWDMPEQDGEAVLKAIRANGLRVPVVVVSGQRRENIKGDLAALAATFANKNELDAGRFRSAIRDSLQLQAVRSPAEAKSEPNGAANET
jgi:CheY-like chemotaxis protein